MTSIEIFEIEKNNFDKIILYKEGIFWKAYEHSAYIVCKQIHPFKVSKKTFKTLKGEDIVSIGFPCKSEEVYLYDLETLERSESNLVLKAKELIVLKDFTIWKTNIPTTQISTKGTRSHESNDTDIVQMIKSFNIANKTPMECLFFVNELKKLV